MKNQRKFHEGMDNPRAEDLVFLLIDGLLFLFLSASSLHHPKRHCFFFRPIFLRFPPLRFFISHLAAPLLYKQRGQRLLHCWSFDPTREAGHPRHAHGDTCFLFALHSFRRGYREVASELFSRWTTLVNSTCQHLEVISRNFAKKPSQPLEGKEDKFSLLLWVMQARLNAE